MSGSRAVMTAASRRSDTARYLDVGVAKRYTSIEAGVEKLQQIQPDEGDEFYIRLVDAAYQLSDAQIYLPENSGIVTGRSDIKPVITGTSGRSQSQGCFNVRSNNLYYGFKVISDPTSSGSAFRSDAGTTGDIRFQNIETSDDGDDSFYLYGGGNYYFDGCLIKIGWDGIAVFASGEAQAINVSNCVLLGKSTENNVLVRVDNVLAVVNIDRSYLALEPIGVRSDFKFAACIGSGLSGNSAVAYDLNVSNSIIKAQNFDTTGSIYKSTIGLTKSGGKLDVDNCDFITHNELTQAEDLQQDGAIMLTNTTDLVNGITNSRIHNHLSSKALSQIDKGGNTVSGFKIT